MATRIKDGIIPYTGGQGIEITNNHVINVLLREMNNLIQVNGDRELYVDLQLPDGIQPSDTFPVGVTTGKILAEDGWQQSGIILNWKTTSGDYVRFIYANDGKLYYDPGTGTWIEIGSGGGGVQINVATASTLGLIKLGSDTQQVQAPVTATSISGRTYPVQLNADNQAVVNIPWENTTYTAGANITIDQNNEISATIPSALVYKGTVNDLTDLPASGTVGDTYFVEGEDGMYSWDGTQWAYVGGTGIDTGNFFDKTVDTSDDITQGTTNLFVTQNEKNTWNGKQDRLTAGDGIDITNNVVSNTLPFEPENSGTLAQVLKKTSTGYRWSNETAGFDPENVGSIGQVLKKTSTGYAWSNESGGGGGGTSYTAGDGISIVGHVISNTKPFEPGTGTAGQVLTKTNDGYAWSSAAAGDSNVKLFPLNSLSDTTNAQAILDWTLAGKMPIIKYNSGIHDAYYCLERNNSTTGSLEFRLYMGPGQGDSGRLKFQEYENIFIRYTGTAVTNISWEKEELNKQWIGTQAEYDLLTPETGVIYNIIPSS